MFLFALLFPRLCYPTGLTFLVLILVLIFRPTGLLSERLPQDAR